MKRKVIMAAVIAAFLLSGCESAKPENRIEYNQRSLMLVVSVNEAEDTVLFRDKTGNLWAIYGADDWCFGDIARVTIENGEITSATYRGFINMEER